MVPMRSRQAPTASAHGDAAAPGARGRRRRSSALRRFKRRLLCIGLVSFVAGGALLIVRALLDASHAFAQHRLRADGDVLDWCMGVGVADAALGALAIHIWWQWPRWQHRIVARQRGSVLTPCVCCWAIGAAGVAAAELYAAWRMHSASRAHTPSCTRNTA